MQRISCAWTERVGQLIRHPRSQRILEVATVLLLLFGVAGFSILAKQSKYLPRFNPLRHYSKAAKMELVHHPVDFIPVAAQPISRIVPPQPEFFATLFVKPGPAFCQACLTTSFHHRGPPSLLA